MGTGGLFLRKIRAKVADQPTGFVWVEKGKLAGSGYPASKRQLEWVRSQGIDSVLTLTESPLPEELTDGVEMEFLHVPMGDHKGPSQADLAKAATIVQERLAAGKKVMVHCLAGEGRTGCVLAAYMIRSRDVDAPKALEIIRGAKREFVEWSQEKAVYEFAATSRYS